MHEMEAHLHDFITITHTGDHSLGMKEGIKRKKQKSQPLDLQAHDHDLQVCPYPIQLHTPIPDLWVRENEANKEVEM